MRRTLALLLLVVLAFSGVGSGTAQAADTTAPKVRIRTPSHQEVVSGVVRVRGVAIDDDHLKKVRVKVGQARFQRVKCRWTNGRCHWKLGFKSWNHPDGLLKVVALAQDASRNRRRDAIRVRVDNIQQATTAEGTTIEVSVPGWSISEIVNLLRENGLDDTIGPSLYVKVQDVYPTQVAASASTSGGSYTNFVATMYLNPNDAFGAQPDATVGHEFGHAWAAYYRFLAQQGDWSGYLDARGLTGDARLESNYAWTKEELIADDYRLLFGSSDAVAERPTHMNRDVPEPKNVAGLKDYLATTWTNES